MGDPLQERDAAADAVRLAASAALEYLDALDSAPLRHPDAVAASESLGRGPLPEDGDGTLAALHELTGPGMQGAIQSAGPRMFHFVTGGVTPAALGADWLATLVDQNALSWVSSPLASRLEAMSVDWLKELFRLPADWQGVITTGATMANFAGLACARQWWAERHGVDLDARGFAGLPEAPVLSGGYVHVSARKALGMLGLGRDGVRTFSRDGAGRLDLDALDRALSDLDGAPAVVIGNAGEVNAGDFDPIDALADVVQRHGAWLHVDGAFGLFARATPRGDALTAGIERADSVIADGHKWLNVPYDCGFAFVREPGRLQRAFGMRAAYLGEADPEHPDFYERSPEASRRARSLAVWATLRAYGRAGHRAMVERHLDLAQRLAARIDEADDLERLAGVPLNVVCFRHRPAGMPEEELDEHNSRLGEAVLVDGRVYMGTTVYDGRVAFRPAIVNWRTTEPDVDAIVDVVRELAATGGGPPIQ
jgi:glutamate/tyrosine decarboxylase-like PLP-dependent enzyme